MIELLRPEHASKCLPHDLLRVSGKIVRNQGRIEVVSLAPALHENLVGAVQSVFSEEIGVRQAKVDDDGLAGADSEVIVCRNLGSLVLRVHRVLGAVHHVVVDGIFHVRPGIGHAEESLVVGIVSVNSRVGEPSQCSHRTPN